MALHRAVGCDTTGCLALHLAPPQSGPDGALYAARRAGWAIGRSGLTMRCPSCHTGGRPVAQRGNCSTCAGATHDSPQGRVCRYCGHVDRHQLVDGQEHAHLTGATTYTEGSGRP